MPNTVPAAAEDLPEINRRGAMSLTGAGLLPRSPMSSRAVTPRLRRTTCPLHPRS